MQVNYVEKMVQSLSEMNEELKEIHILLKELLEAPASVNQDTRDQIPAAYAMPKPSEYKPVSMESQISRFCNQIGIPVNTKGYSCVKVAVELLIINPNLGHAITTQLYPEVAEKTGTTNVRVERNIRHSILTAYRYGNRPLLARILPCAHSANSEDGMTIGTNAEFLIAVAQYMIDNNMLSEAR